MNSPEWPSFSVESGPEILQWSQLVFGVANFSLEIFRVEGGLGEEIQRIGLFLWSFLFTVVFSGFLLFLLLWFFLLFGLLFLLWLLFLLFGWLLLFLWLFFFGSNWLRTGEFRDEFFGAKPEFTKVLLEWLKVWNFFKPSGQVWKVRSALFVEDQSEGISQVSGQSNIRDGNFTGSQELVVLQPSINDSQCFPEFFSGGIVLFLGDWEVSKNGIVNSWEVGVNLSVDEFEPLVNAGSLGSVWSIHLSCLSGEVSHDWVGFENASFWCFESWNFSPWMFLQVFCWFPLGEGDSFEFDLEVEESQKDFDLGSGWNEWLRRVKFVWHF